MDLVEGMAMRGVIRRTAVAAGAVLVLLGLPATVASARSAPADLAFRPAVSDLGPVSVGQTRQQQLRLVNTGGRASSALTVTVSGSAAFTVALDTCTGRSLGPGRSCTVTMRFTPAAGGLATATVSVVSRNRAATATAQLTGTGRRIGSAPFTHLYWTSYDGSFYFINAGPLAGGPVTTVTALPTTANYVAVDENFVYWSDSQDRSIRRVSLTGGPSTTLASGLGSPQGIAVDGTHVYWADLQTGTINAVPLTGGSVTTLVSGQSDAFGLAVDTGHVYWSTSTGTINQAPLTGGSATTLVTGERDPAGVAVDNNTIYWADINGQPGGNGIIRSAHLGVGPTTATTLATGQNLPLGVVVHDGRLYWANAGDNTINTLPVTGGTASTLFSGLNQPKGVAVGP